MSNEEEAYNKHIKFIEKETALPRDIIIKVLEADEKYLDLIIEMMEEGNHV
ncbi:hypothetical protein CLSAB_19230 [Clostridium saccharobutylicum]|uniref:hypothetical protein n=1 Tax=Clostridium saccharobutylicum TaxID=169679 RepID=UPI0009D07C37|nr:hypothetical protein [Clostridium saccharobutylicum]OOM17203.1 hypothetical protein CLSAB_19230 [Clostridium saccharobutylicum]